MGAYFQDPTTMYQEKIIRGLIPNSDYSYWEINTTHVGWSTKFMELTGYTPKTIRINLNYFLFLLSNNQERDLFRDNYFGLLNEARDFEQTLTITHKDGSHKTLKCKSINTLPIKKHHPESKILFFQLASTSIEDRIERANFYYRETAEMTSSGGWFINLAKKSIYWDQECKRILECPQDYKPSLKTIYKYISSDYYGILNNLFNNCTMLGKPFDAEIKMRTAKNREFWVRAIGKPVYNETQNIVGIRGVFQDIDELKTKELDLKRTSEIIHSQNQRLFNFAHIVSHNLRSHTSNLALIMQFMEETNDPVEKEELISSIKDISESLNETIHHLNEVVTIQTQTTHSRINVSFKESLGRVLKSIISLIVQHDVTIDADFKNVEHVQYIPAYLDSIFLNLITNAIKYRQENRTPIIAIRTYLKDGRTYLEVSDNGQGIDLKIHGHKLFEMYKTFHRNKDAVGVGLFITKNQIESLNGEIFVDSGVQQGTTFTVKL